VLSIAHIAVGAAIGSATGNTTIAVILAFFSYYLVNSIPHWHPNIHLKSQRGRIIAIADFVLSVGLLIVFAKYIPSYINDKNSTVPAFYNFTVSNVHILISCIAAVLPNILRVPEMFDIHVEKLDWHKKLLDKITYSDRGFLGKLVQPAIVLVFTLYSFRLLPNSETNTFFEILLLMLFVVTVLAILEVFSENPKKK
jgi:hypothetical protein